VPEWVKDGIANSLNMKRLFSLVLIFAGVLATTATTVASPAPTGGGGEISYMTNFDDDCTGSTYACAVVTPDGKEQ